MVFIIIVNFVRLYREIPNTLIPVPVKMENKNESVIRTCLD
jgi:hypothetical protein